MGFSYCRAADRLATLHRSQQCAVVGDGASDFRLCVVSCAFGHSLSLVTTETIHTPIA